MTDFHWHRHELMKMVLTLESWASQSVSVTFILQTMLCHGADWSSE